MGLFNPPPRPPLPLSPLSPPYTSTHIRSTITITSSNYNIVPFPYTYIVCIYICILFSPFSPPPPRRRAGSINAAALTADQRHYYTTTTITTCLFVPPPSLTTAPHRVTILLRVVHTSHRSTISTYTSHLRSCVHGKSYTRIFLYAYIARRRSQSVRRLLFYHFSIKFRILYYDVYAYTIYYICVHCALS